ncbi:MAG: acetyl-CoA carboxylase, carboxyltransferase subunit beta [Bacteroidota bacterium]
MAWFNREKKGIVTPTELKREAPDGLWYKCPECKTVILTKAHKDNAWTCTNCNYHTRVGSVEYFELLFDNNEFTELDANMTSGDPLEFNDNKPYPERIAATIVKSGLNDAVRTGYGKISGVPLVIACMDFTFIGGSMGSVVGEKIARAVNHAIKTESAMLIISKSGGARMMEAGFSLMQMAKTSARLALLADAGLPYISLLTDPTTGGVTASYAMLGDLNIAEPKSLIGFAGPRVIRETIGKDLPAGFQSAEFVLEHGFLDLITDRKEMKATLTNVLKMLMFSRLHSHDDHAHVQGAAK